MRWKSTGSTVDLSFLQTTSGTGAGRTCRNTSASGVLLMPLMSLNYQLHVAHARQGVAAACMADDLAVQPRGVRGSAPCHPVIPQNEGRAVRQAFGTFVANYHEL